MPEGRRHFEDVFEAEVLPPQPPLRIEGGMLRGHQAASLAHEIANPLQLLVAQALLIGERQHTVPREVFELVVEDYVERNLILDKNLLEEHGALQRAVVIEGHA